MYPSGHHEAIALQGRQPGGPSAFQQNVVIGDLPKDHIVWSICSLLHGNPFCLGLAALIYSAKDRDRKVVGDIEGARKHGSTACCLNTVVVILTLLIVIPIIIVVTVGVYGMLKGAAGPSKSIFSFN